MFKTALIGVLLLAAVATADEAAMKQKLKDCFSKEMDKENSAAAGDMKLSDANLGKMKKIVHDEIDKEPLKKHTAEEQKKCYKDMEDEAKKSMPDVKTEAVDKILHVVHEKSKHCVKELGS